MSEDTQRIDNLQNQLNILQGELLKGLADKVETYVGLKNLVRGKMYFIDADGHKRKLMGRGDRGDHIIIDGRTWRMLQLHSGALERGEITRDDSILKPGMRQAAPDVETSPNIVTDAEIKAFATQKPGAVAKRVAEIDNPEVLQRIITTLDAIDGRSADVLDVVERRLNGLLYNLPDNFYTMNLKELKAFASSREIDNIRPDIQTTKALRQEILDILSQG